jgi:drug/metabolite transporter (DMT)-like permease
MSSSMQRRHDPVLPRSRSAHRSTLPYHLALTLVAALWGGAFVAIRNLDASGRISAPTITLLRFALTAAVMLPIAVARLVRIARADRWRVGLMALLGGLVYHLALNEGERFVSAGVASLIVACTPVFVALLAVRFLGERMTAVRALGIGLAASGVAVLVVWGSGGGSLQIRNLMGALVVLIAPAAWATSTVVGKPAAQRYDPIGLTALTMVLSAALIAPFTLASAIHDVPGLTWADWLQLAYLAFGCTALAYLIWWMSLRHLEATAVAGYIYVVPVFTLVWAALFLGERLTIAGIVGGAMVLAGVLVAERLAPRVAAARARAAGAHEPASFPVERDPDWRDPEERSA